MSEPRRPWKANAPIDQSSGPAVGPDETRRLARHQALCDLWRAVPLSELLTDLNVLIQLITLRDYQERESR
jgi:hypothetical protein